MSHRTRNSRDADLKASVLDAWTDVKQDGSSGRLYGPMSEVTDGAIVLSGVHCDVEMTISESDGAKLDFGYGEVETVCHDNFMVPKLLDFGLPAEPETNVDGLGGNCRYLRRVTDRQAISQPACSGTVHLLWLQEDISLILAPSRRKEGVYERLGIFHPGMDTRFYKINSPKMPKTVQQSNINLV